MLCNHKGKSTLNCRALGLDHEEPVAINHSKQEWQPDRSLIGCLQTVIFRRRRVISGRNALVTAYKEIRWLQVYPEISGRTY